MAVEKIKLIKNASKVFIYYLVWTKLLANGLQALFCISHGFYHIQLKKKAFICPQEANAEM